MRQNVYCLAVRQPWAWALVTGAKDIENRSWKTQHRGTVVILASAAKILVKAINKGAHPPPPISFQYGALIGVVDLLDVSPLSEELETNPWASGPYCWRMGNARCFAEPIPAKGQLNLYTLPPDLATRATAAIAKAKCAHRDAIAEAWIHALTHLDSEEVRENELYNSYMGLKDGANALRLSDRAVSLRGTAEAYINRAEARHLNGELDAALTDVNRALEMDPSNAGGFWVRSQIYGDLGDRDMQKAADLDPAYAE
jgi:tetratricopeptide (TPR) repeat protein